MKFDRFKYIIIPELFSSRETTVLQEEISWVFSQYRNKMFVGNTIKVFELLLLRIPMMRFIIALFDALNPNPRSTTLSRLAFLSI